MNVIFLDYDGVVNTPQWSLKNSKWICTFNWPRDNKVNNIQAVQWVSEFCEKYDYQIVVSSTWRLHDNYEECLHNAGLRKGIKIIGRTSICDNGRQEEISLWLSEHPEVERYLIFDDENVKGFEDYLIKCDTSTGFGKKEFEYAERLHKTYKRK